MFYVNHLKSWQRGNQSGNKRNRGRPIAWKSPIENDLSERSYTWARMKTIANNLLEWKKRVLVLCAIKHSQVWIKGKRMVVLIIFLMNSAPYE